MSDSNSRNPVEIYDAVNTLLYYPKYSRDFF